MTDTKSILASKTVWGALIAVAPMLLQTAGVNLTADETSALGGLIDPIVSLVGFVLAVYGRVSATKAIG